MAFFDGSVTIAKKDNFFDDCNFISVHIRKKVIRKWICWFGVEMKVLCKRRLPGSCQVVAPWSSTTNRGAHRFSFVCKGHTANN
jgi:hypothetical protein